MRSTLDELTKELEELRALVASITPVNKVLAGHQDSLVRQYVLVRRRFDYAAFAVALYASFEKFIENLVAAFAQLESLRLQYTDLPPKLVKKHISRTAEMLSRGRIGEGRYVGLTELEVVKNLFECLNGARPYTLNEAAVVAHDLNLRAGEIDLLFAAVGIERPCDRVRRTDILVEWYCAAQGLDAAPQDGVPAAIVEKRLEDIVDRRNQVTHRGGNPVDLLGADDMTEAVWFIEAFSRSVFSLAVGRYLQNHHVAAAIELRQRRRRAVQERNRCGGRKARAQALRRSTCVSRIVGSVGALGAHPEPQGRRRRRQSRRAGHRCRERDRSRTRLQVPQRRVAHRASCRGRRRVEPVEDIESWRRADGLSTYEVTGSDREVVSTGWAPRQKWDDVPNGSQVGACAPSRMRRSRSWEDLSRG
ncbi:MAG: MAE_28990/MAE_18760 family HEPN-like nuclease [Polyangiaceae bacterium]